MLLIAVLATGTSFYTFVDKFGWGYWTEISEWGATGDFFGGILNPIFAFLSLILLAFTLWQNQKALENNSEELKLSRQELSNSVTAQRTQVHQAKMQRFEDTFFSLLSQLKSSDDEKVTEFVYKNVMVKDYDPQWIATSILRESKVFIYPNGGNINRYFRTLYQLLKFIAHKCPESTLQGEFSIQSLSSSHCSETEKTYANIVRATIDSKLIILLAINCYCKDENDPFYKYLLLIKRYSFLEHMPLSVTSTEKKHVMQAILTYHDKQTFGNNINIV